MEKFERCGCVHGHKPRISSKVPNRYDNVRLPFIASVYITIYGLDTKAFILAFFTNALITLADQSNAIEDVR